MIFSGIALILAGLCLIPAIIKLDPVCFIALPIWIIDAILYEIFAIALVIEIIDYNNKIYEDTRKSTVSMNNNYNYNYEIYIKIYDYEHLSDAITNDNYDYNGESNIIYNKADVIIDQILIGFLEVFSTSVIKQNINSNEYISLWNKNNPDQWETKRVYTCMETLPIIISIEDEDDGYFDEDDHNDWIDVTLDTNVRGFLVYNIIDDKLVYDSNVNYFYDENIDIPVRKLGPKTFILEPSGDFDRKGSLTIVIMVNELN